MGVNSLLTQREYYLTINPKARGLTQSILPQFVYDMSNPNLTGRRRSTRPRRQRDEDYGLLKRTRTAGWCLPCFWLVCRLRHKRCVLKPWGLVQGKCVGFWVQFLMRTRNRRVLHGYDVADGFANKSLSLSMPDFWFAAQQNDVRTVLRVRRDWMHNFASINARRTNGYNISGNDWNHELYARNTNRHTCAS